MRSAIIGLLTLACLYTLYFAADLLVPLCIAVLLALTLQPVVSMLARLGVPRLLGAAAVVLGTVSLLAVGISLLWEPAVEWMSQAPAKLAELRPRILELRASMQDLESASREISEAADDDNGDDGAVTVRVAEPTMLDSLAARGLPIVGRLVAIIFLMYFLLAYGDSVLRKVYLLARRSLSAEDVLRIASSIQSQVSRFLIVITLINATLAVLVSTVLYLIDFPNPVMWGVIAGALNYAPYVGATITAALIAVVGLLNLDSLALALAVPAGFILLTALEGQLVTPTVLGRELALSPYVVFLSILLWGWLWGIPGALMAVPLLVITKIVADALPSLEWLSIALRRDAGETPLHGHDPGAEPATARAEP